MSLRVNTNITAQNAHRNMATNDANMSKSIERLSSGLRINSAADDAAGLVISENMRTQISGTDQASRNTQDGVNMFKTTEASLNEVETQLRNIRDLTLHAGNATTTADMLAADQAQVNQALASIDRIANQTTWNGMKLLADDAGGNNINNKIFQTGAYANQTQTLALGGNVADMRATNLGFTGGVAAFAKADSTNAYVAGTQVENFSLQWNKADGTVGNYAFAVTGAGTDTIAQYAAKINTAMAGITVGATNLGALVVAQDNGSGKMEFTLTNNALNANEKTNTSKLTVASTSSTGAGALFGPIGLSATGSSATGLTLAQGTTATNLATIDAALAKVNTLRVNLGAFQKNNLESNLNTLAVAKENITASESAIRDTDMASEMVTFTKNQILTQAAQAMLTQANQAPQNILQMLKG